MRDGDALRSTGRAGSVDNVGEIVRGSLPGRISFILSGNVFAFTINIDSSARDAPAGASRVVLL